jgi:hypothetical protein
LALFERRQQIKELKDTLTKFMKEADEEKLKSAVKLLRAVMR